MISNLGRLLFQQTGLVENPDAAVTLQTRVKQFAKLWGNFFSGTIRGWRSFDYGGGGAGSHNDHSGGSFKHFLMIIDTGLH